MNKLLMQIILLLLFVIQMGAYSQKLQNIDLKYLVNGKYKKIRDDSKVLFIQKGDTIESRIREDKIYTSSIDPGSVVDVLFFIGKKELFFVSISTDKLSINQETVWELGYYDNFPDEVKKEFYQIEDFSQIAELYYWKFQPQEFGDGTVILVTVPKD